MNSETMEAYLKMKSSFEKFAKSAEEYPSRLEEIRQRFEYGMEDLKLKAHILNALVCAGYRDLQPTKENLISCFLDYVDSGSWSNLSMEEAERDIKDGCITSMDMVKALKSVR